MAEARPFSKNLGPNIGGTEQIGDLAVGTPTTGFESTGLKWWNGPDETLGYIIAVPRPGNRIGADGETASLSFWRSKEKTDESFLQLAKTALGQTFVDVESFKTALTAAGYWNSHGLDVGAFANAIITSNNEYISVGEGEYLAYNN